MGNSKDYQELVQKMTMYLDKELSTQAEKDFLVEINENPSYVEILSKERTFRDFIKSRIQRRKVSPALIQSIKEKIRTTSS